MYQGQGLGSGPLLPSTGGSKIVTIMAITAVVLGVVIVVSTIVRIIAKKAFTKS